MKTIKILNWILGVLGAFIVIALVIVILPWKNHETDNAANADAGKAEATAMSEEALQTAPAVPETASLQNAVPGDCVIFGHYEQDNDEANGPEEIKWLVLERGEDQLLLLSLYGLDCQAYHDKTRFVYWSNCVLRPWLSETFLQTAFTEEEQEAILETTVTADENPMYHTPAGSAVEEKVFLLSLAEADRYFSSNAERLCLPTEYARAQGVYVKSGFVACWWWLRSPGRYGDHAACVGNLGDFYYVGLGVKAGDVAIRPAIWIKTGT